MKSQGVRLFDVLILGPFLVWAGAKVGGLSKTERGLLVAAGIGTVIYNAKNYLELEAQNVNA